MNDGLAAAVVDQTGFDLIPWIPVVVVVAGAIAAGFWNAHNRRRGEVATDRQRRTPSWVELANENRELRDENRDLGDENRQLRTENTTKVDELRADFERRFSALEAATRAKDAATARAFRAIAATWQGPPPQIDSDDLAILEDTWPVAWKVTPFGPPPSVIAGQ